MIFEQDGDVSFPCISNSRSGYKSFTIRYELHFRVPVIETSKVAIKYGIIALEKQRTFS
jgi:hypothetical protein